ncbi:MAG TPA: zinc ribbon domain-containing protein [Chloroflexia bacterium]|nr:zinc ribbon domain-containing protein [Chloroflexia bacterium]
MSQNCPNCGVPVRENYRFCSNCGASTVAPVQSTPSESKPPGEQPADATGAPVTYRVQSWEAENAASSPSEPLVPPPPPNEPYPQYIPPAPPPVNEMAGAPVRPAQNRSGAPAPLPGTDAYSPNTPGRKDGAAYAGYTTEAAARLEKPRSERSWLIPVIAGAALVMIVLLGVAGYYLVNNRGQVAPPQQSAPPTIQSLGCKEPPAGASEEERVKYVVCVSNEEQIKGWHDLDTEVLKGTRTGQVLQENVTVVEELKRQGMFATPTNHRLDILSVNVKGDTATVKTIEEWSITFYRKSDDSKVRTEGPDTLNETYHLRKQDGKWLIYRMEYAKQ